MNQRLTLRLTLSLALRSTLRRTLRSTLRPTPDLIDESMMGLGDKMSPECTEVVGPLHGLSPKELFERIRKVVCRIIWQFKGEGL